MKNTVFGKIAKRIIGKHAQSVISKKKAVKETPGPKMKKLSGEAEAEIKKNIQQFRLCLLRYNPFYGDFLLETPIEATYDIETAQTNGRIIQYNPAFFNELERGQINYVLLHELLHILLLHCTKRTRADNKLLMNIACDFVVNDIIDRTILRSRRKPGFELKRPKDGFYLIFNNMSVEGLYAFLVDNNPNVSSKGINCSTLYVQDGKGRNYYNQTVPISANDLVDYDGPSSLLELDEDMRRRIKECIRKCRSDNRGGDIPDEFLQMMDVKKIHWAKYLREFLIADQETETSYLTPERKYIHMDLIVPGSSREYDKLDEIWAFIDTSGSMSAKELNEIMTQLYRIAKEFEAVVNVAYWDTVVSSVYKKVRDPKKLFECYVKHRGGTDIKCVYDYIEANKIKPNVLFIMTDGYFGDVDTPILKKLKSRTILLLSNNNLDDIKYKKFGIVVRT